MYASVNILYHILIAFKWCSAPCAGKVRINMTEKDVVLTENLMFQDNSGLFTDIIVLQIKCFD